MLSRMFATVVLTCSASSIATISEVRAGDISPMVALCDTGPGCTHGNLDAQGGMSFVVRHKQVIGHIYCFRDGFCAKVQANSKPTKERHTENTRDRKKSGRDNLQKFLDILRSMNVQI